MKTHSAQFRYRFISLQSDFGFKKVLSNPILMMHFLNQLPFLKKEKIISIVYNNTVLSGRTKAHRTVIFDLTCTANNGTIYIIEMQCDEVGSFIARANAYVSMRISETLPKGKAGNGYSETPLRFVGILNFMLYGEDRGTEHHNIQSVDKELNEDFPDNFSKLFIELPVFNKSLEALENDYERWIWLFIHLHTLEEIPSVFVNHPEFSLLFELAEYHNLNTMEQNIYDTYFSEERDRRSADALKERRAEEKRIKAEAEGREKGREEGREEGKKIGFKEGIDRMKTEFCQKMLAESDYGIAQIAHLTGLTEQDVLRIKNELKL